MFTLFIVGAGASAEVGLPVGLRFVKMIAQQLDIKSGAGQNTPGDQLIAQLYQKHPQANDAFHQAARLIRNDLGR